MLPLCHSVLELMCNFIVTVAIIVMLSIKLIHAVLMLK